MRILLVVLILSLTLFYMAWGDQGGNYLIETAGVPGENYLVETEDDVGAGGSHFEIPDNFSFETSEFQEN